MKHGSMCVYDDRYKWWACHFWCVALNLTQLARPYGGAAPDRGHPRSGPDVPVESMMDVGRGTPWGNPYRVGEKCKRCGQPHTLPGDTIHCFIDYAIDRLHADRDWLAPLVGKDLHCPGCIKDSTTCHVRILEYLRDHQDEVL